VDRGLRFVPSRARSSIRVRRLSWQVWPRRSLPVAPRSFQRGAPLGSIQWSNWDGHN